METRDDQPASEMDLDSFLFMTMFFTAKSSVQITSKLETNHEDRLWWSQLRRFAIF